jgi:hypothetical protein
MTLQILAENEVGGDRDSSLHDVDVPQRVFLPEEGHQSDKESSIK